MCIIEDLESDHFARLDPTHAVIRNVQDQVLFVDPGKQAVFEDMTDADIKGIFFYIFTEMTAHLFPFHSAIGIFSVRPHP